MMTDKPPEPEDDQDIQRRFEETLKQLLNTPHKPHEKSASAVKKSGAKSRKAR